MTYWNSDHVPFPGAVARQGVEMLIRRLADGASSEVVLLPPALTIRGSTGRAPVS